MGLLYHLQDKKRLYKQSNIHQEIHIILYPHFFIPPKIYNELVVSSFNNIDIIAVEGFANALDSDKMLENEEQANLLLEYIRKTERIPELMGISGHYFAITRK